ncbi:sulfatase-like hydrolase/transferase [Parvularcula sp. ZS-1/3]|uniref:Sulfatase-like hydrolase/transferase n=1 Tax=Parvularcula mediterranea TaxID=2732508 RepID=A0A7Y3RLD4_9PROT|nr:sulfatase-like hydrolase/transferase [Parvularcula mediterranea]NNU16231.1 sulfatase-like hydrolase/transferase [Parvularcula mediterranea]
MHRKISASILALLLSACEGHEATQPESEAKTEAFDFGGVFDDTYAGEIDRTVEPRRPDGPPNVVLIIADDLGWPYLGFLGDENVVTPNMDIIGNGGTVFEVGHATSNFCRPTLQTLITGLYPVQYDQRANEIVENALATDGVPDSLDSQREQSMYRQKLHTSAIEQFKTLPRILQDQGYVSHQSGKWWEQSYAHGGFTHGMTESWDVQDAVDLGDRWFFTFMGGQGQKIGRETMEPLETFIEEHADQPFFVWYGPALPHTPLNAPNEFYKYFAERDDLSQSAKLYYANIAWFDWGVGKILDTLHDQRVMDNTLIVYINDNGWEQDADVEYTDDNITFANGGPRGKGSFFETGFRTPIIFYWQGKITAMRDTANLASALDIMPTILDYVGVEAPEDLPGYSLRPAIEAGSLPAPREYFIGRMTQHRAGTNFRGEPDDFTDDHMGAARSGYYRRDLRWHFVWLPETGETALYDLENDPGQLADVSEENPELISTFKSDIEDWQEQYERG